MKKKNFITKIYNSNLSNLNKPRLNICIWIRDFETKADCDTFVEFARGKYTDVSIFAIDDGAANRQWGGTSTLGTSSTTSINGKTPWAYLYDSLHSANIRVSAWMWLSTFVYWGGTTGVNTNIPNNSTYNDGGVWNFNNATARTTMVNQLKDFTDNNNTDGLVFNLEAIGGSAVLQDTTDFVTAVRSAIPNKEIAWYTGAGVGVDSLFKIDTFDWLDKKYIDTIHLMGYYDNLQEKNYLFDTLNISENDKRIIVGLGTESNFVTASDFKHKWLMLKNNSGYRNYFHFIWEDNFENDSALRDAVVAFKNNTLSALQGDITKLSVTPSTSWTITVEGVDQTTNYADVTNHVYSGPLKTHIEAAIGSQNPAIFYTRANSATTRICIGDFDYG